MGVDCLLLMRNLCILTDSSVQFARKTFTGQNRVKVMPLSEVESGPRGQAALIARFAQLAPDYDTIFVLGISCALHPFSREAALAARQFGGTSAVHVMDSQNTSIGLGLLVELAAELAAAGCGVTEIQEAIRRAMPHIYTLLCCSDLQALAEAGLLGDTRAALAEMPGLHSVFMLDEGRLLALERVRSGRHVIESLREFVEEFSPPRRVSIVRGADCALRTRPLKEYVSGAFPEAAYSEQALNPALEALFGRESLGFVIYE
jgi:DegV family protein with EDD domain